MVKERGLERMKREGGGRTLKGNGGCEVERDREGGRQEGGRRRE